MWAAMRPMEVTRLASAPRFHFVVRFVFADRGDEEVPLALIGVRLGAGRGPNEVFLGESLAFEDAALGAPDAFVEDGAALAAVDIPGELFVAADDVAAVHVELRAVGECVLDRVLVEVLVDAVVLVVPPAGRLRLDRPGSLSSSSTRRYCE